MPEDLLKPHFELNCKDDKYEEDHCYVAVRLERKDHPIKPEPTIPPSVQTGVSIIAIIIAFVIFQLVLGCIIVPILYCVLKSSKRQGKKVDKFEL